MKIGLCFISFVFLVFASSLGSIAFWNYDLYVESTYNANDIQTIVEDDSDEVKAILR